MKRKIFFTLFVLFSLSINSQVPSNIPFEGLIGWWPFNNNSIDESEFFNDGFVDGAVFSNDRFNNTNSSLLFDGIDDYVSIDSPQDNNLSDLNEFTISLWVNVPSDFIPVDQGLFTKWIQQTTICGSEVGESYWVGIYGGNSTFIGATKCNNNPVSCIGSEVINDEKWHHIVYSHGDGIEKFYFDGNLVSESIYVGDICATSNTIYIGCDNYLGVNGNMFRFFNGYIDDIGMWNRNLSDEEIMLFHRESLSEPTTTTDVNDHSHPTDFGGKVECYPNPTTDVINVDLSGLNDYSGQKLRIMNLSGQIVYEENVNQSKVVIDVKSVMTSGIYVLNTVDRNGTITSTNKFVVQ
jgi:hypothetical protein